MTAASLHDAGRLRFGGHRLPRVLADLVGYGFVSVVALACDYGLLLALTTAGLHYLLAATVSFTAGMFVAYALSVRFVFARRRALTREAEAAGFFAVGLLGLLLTQGLLAVFVSRGGLGVGAAKVPTTAIVFAFNFLCRRGLVFSGAGARRPPGD